MLREKALVLTFACCVFAFLEESQISNGYDAAPNQFPFMAAIERNGKQICGGAIIAVNRILTAAHCTHNVLDVRALKVRVGTVHFESGGVLCNVRLISPHFQHRVIGKRDTNDIAIIWLTENLEFNKAVRSIPIATSRDRLPIGSLALLAGWGYLNYSNKDPDNLQYTRIRVFDDKECNKAHGKHLDGRMFCAGDVKKLRGPCPGDSGGPLVANGKVIGVVSFGDCEYPVPAVFVNVALYNKWVKMVESSGV